MIVELRALELISRMMHHQATMRVRSKQKLTWSMELMKPLMRMAFNHNWELDTWLWKGNLIVGH